MQFCSTLEFDRRWPSACSGRAHAGGEVDEALQCPSPKCSDSVHRPLRPAPGEPRANHYRADLGGFAPQKSVTMKSKAPILKLVTDGGAELVGIASGHASDRRQDGQALAIRAAWLHHVGNINQNEISRMMGLSRVKVNRLIAQAHKDGHVRIYVEGSADRCIDFEERLKARYGLRACEVVPNFSETALPLDTLGAAGARFLARQIADPAVKLVGVGTGRTLSRMASQLPSSRRADIDFVSLIGTFRRSTAIDQFDVIHQLSTKVGGKCFAIPAPFITDSIDYKNALSSQDFVKTLFAMGRNADIKMLGVGEIAEDAHLFEIGMMNRDEYLELVGAGAVAEAAGIFFDKNGKQVFTSIHERVIGPSRADLEINNTVLLAGGLGKIKAIHVSLLAGFAKGLITDEKTAENLLAYSKSKSA